MAGSIDWHGLYGEGWKDEIVKKAYKHPAKYSRALIRHIYRHMIEEGWLTKGDRVIDPFGGVALGGIDAMRHGLDWTGVELEKPFVYLGSQNIALWNRRYAKHFPNWGTARLLHGDSRDLCSVLDDGSYSGSISSPPYAEARIDGNGDEGSGSLRLPDGSYPRGREGWEMRKAQGSRYSGAVSSPPYAETVVNATANRIVENGKPYWRPYMDGQGRDNYGSTPGQLGAMKALHLDAAIRGYSYDAAVSSPPYEGIEVAKGDAKQASIEDRKARRARGEWEGYNKGNKNNLGSNRGEDFWMAARSVVEQVYQVLAPGAHAVWVVKAFVKNRQIVPFPDQWQKLCEAVGFAPVHYHRAYQVDDRGTQFDIFGNAHERKVDHRSHFRKVIEKNGSPVIDHEVVLCMVKP